MLHDDKSLLAKRRFCVHRMDPQQSMLPKIFIEFHVLYSLLWQINMQIACKYQASKMAMINFYWCIEWWKHDCNWLCYFYTQKRFLEISYEIYIPSNNEQLIWKCAADRLFCSFSIIRCDITEGLSTTPNYKEVVNLLIYR